MCGRYLLTLPPDVVRAILGYDEQPNFPARYNIAPTQPIAVVEAGLDGTRHFRLVRWGLIPSWTKDAATPSLLVNARAETAADKPSFRAAMRHRRCLVPADGFYEWRRTGERGGGQPYLIRRRDGGLLAFAGLVETWMGAEGSEIDTGAILTTSANRLMAAIHDRMPVILAPEDWERWLDCGRYRPADVADLMRPAPEGLLEAVPVSTRVNRVVEDGPRLVEPLTEPLTAEVESEASGPDPKPAKRKRRKPSGPPAQGSLF